MLEFLPAADDFCGKVMFLHLSVILFTGGGGLCLGEVSAQGGLCPGQQEVSVQGGLCLGVSVQGGGGLYPVGLCPVGFCPVGSLSWKPPLYGGRAGGTHPTGTHSCSSILKDGSDFHRFSKRK